MSKKCFGCGVLPQDKDPLKPGFIKKTSYDIKLCTRCFRIKNYGDYSFVNKDSNDYEKIFNTVKKEKDLTLFLCDILSLDETLELINEFLPNVILVITKKDLLPKSVKEQKLVSYINKNYNINVSDIIFVCSNKNYNLDKLFDLINKRKNSSKVYLVGKTNSGKSSLINAFLKSYSNFESLVTTSLMPATTLDLLEVKLNCDITFIDTPGIIDKESYLNNLDEKEIKKVSVKKEIKPRTYQMKPYESLLVDSFLRIDYLSEHKNSFTLYLSNDIKVKRIKLNTNDNLRNLDKISFDLKDNKDIVIKDLLFCKITKSAKVNVYLLDKSSIHVRDNLI